MIRRLLIPELAIGLPVVLVLVMAIYARALPQTTYLPEYGPAEERAVLAYVGPFAAVRDLQLYSPQEAPVERIREVAREWVALAEQGRLHEIPPMLSGDGARESAVAQIVQARSELARALLRYASYERAEGRYREALEDLFLVLRLSEVGKYSNFGSVGAAADCQAHALLQLERLWPRLDGAQRQRATDELVRCVEHQRPLSELLLAVRKLYRRNQLLAERPYDDPLFEQEYAFLDSLIRGRSESARGVIARSRFLEMEDGLTSGLAASVATAVRAERSIVAAAQRITGLDFARTGTGDALVASARD